MSYPSNFWEYRVAPADSHYTYYVPVTPEMVGRPIEAVVLAMKGAPDDGAALKCDVSRAVRLGRADAVGCAVAAPSGRRELRA